MSSSVGERRFGVERKEGWCGGAVTMDSRRVTLSTSTSISLSPQKAAACAALLGIAVYAVANAWVGSDVMRLRVARLEHAMQQKLSWVLKHRSHLQAHMRHETVAGEEEEAGAGVGAVPVQPGEPHADGKKHLLIPHGGYSRLAQAMGSNTQLAPVESHYLCGDKDVSEDEVMRATLAIAAISYRSPRSLENSMRTWRDNGLLDVVDEKMLFLNSPSEEDINIGRTYDFDVYTTLESNGNVMVGKALAYLVDNSSADYILLMEKDFILNSPPDVTKRELYTGMQLLANGVDAYRLRGQSDFPAEGNPDCCTPRNPPTCPYLSHWGNAGSFGDHMNWLLIYCDPNVIENSRGRIAHCTKEPEAPESYCFTSGETNWSNNPIIFRRDWFEKRLRAVATRPMEGNQYFEFYAMLEWLTWNPPAIVCTSLRGIFTHFEVDQ